MNEAQGAAVFGAIVTMMTIVASAVWAVARAQAAAEKLGVRVEAVVLELAHLRDDLRAYAAEARSIAADHERRIGIFEGGRDIWLALQKNGSGEV